MLSLVVGAIFALVVTPMQPLTLDSRVCRYQRVMDTITDFAIRHRELSGLGRQGKVQKTGWKTSVDVRRLPRALPGGGLPPRSRGGRDAREPRNGRRQPRSEVRMGVEVSTDSFADMATVRVAGFSVYAAK